MRSSSLALFVALMLGAGGASASSIAKEPLLRVLRSANPAIRACSERHVLPTGRYVVRVTILGGRAREVRLTEGGEDVAPRARACVESAFAALGYPELGSLRDGTPEVYRVAYPFVLVEPPLPPPRDVAPRVRPRPARVGIATR